MTDRRGLSFLLLAACLSSLEASNQNFKFDYCLFVDICSALAKVGQSFPLLTKSQHFCPEYWSVLAFYGERMKGLSASTDVPHMGRDFDRADEGFKPVKLQVAGHLATQVEDSADSLVSQDPIPEYV